jgi:hypothetical protein
MKTLLSLLALCLCAQSIVRADDVEDALNTALRAYKEGKTAEAGSAIQTAQKLINAKAGLSLAAALPDMIGQWKGGKIDSKSLDGIGGGQALERSYRQGSKEKNNEKKATVTITADSPLMNQVMGFLANPALGSLLGARSAKIGDLDAMLLPKQGLLQMIVAKRYLVAVQAKKLSEPDLIQIASGVKVDVLKAMK